MATSVLASMRSGGTVSQTATQSAAAHPTANGAALSLSLPSAPPPVTPRRRRDHAAAPLSASAFSSALLQPPPVAAAAAPRYLHPTAAFVSSAASPAAASTHLHVSPRRAVKHFHIDPLTLAAQQQHQQQQQQHAQGPGTRSHTATAAPSMRVVPQAPLSAVPTPDSVARYRVNVYNNESLHALAAAVSASGAASARSALQAQAQSLVTGPHSARALLQPQPMPQRRLRGAPQWQPRSQTHPQLRSYKDAVGAKSRPSPLQQQQQQQSHASPFQQRNRAQAQRALEQHAEEQMERLFGLMPSQLQHPPSQQPSAAASVAPTPRRTLSPQRSRASLHSDASITAQAGSLLQASAYPLLQPLRSPRSLTVAQAAVAAAVSPATAPPLHSTGASAPVHTPFLHTANGFNAEPRLQQVPTQPDQQFSWSPRAQGALQQQQQQQAPLEPDPMWSCSGGASPAGGSSPHSGEATRSPPASNTPPSPAAVAVGAPSTATAPFVAASPRSAQLHALWTEQYAAMQSGSAAAVSASNEAAPPQSYSLVPSVFQQHARSESSAAPAPAAEPAPVPDALPAAQLSVSPRTLHERASPSVSAPHSSGNTAPAKPVADPSMHLHTRQVVTEAGASSSPPALGRPASLARSGSLARSETFARSTSTRSLHAAGLSSDAAALQAAQAKFASVNALLDEALESARSAPGVSATAAANRTRSFKQLHAAPADGRPTGGAMGSFGSFGCGGLSGLPGGGPPSRTSSGLHLRRPSTSLSASVVEDDVASALSFSIAERMEANRSAVDPAFRRRMQQQTSRAQMGSGSGGGSAQAPERELVHWALHVHEQIVAERKAAAAEAERVAEEKKKEEAAAALQPRPPPPARSASMMPGHTDAEPAVLPHSDAAPAAIAAGQ